MEKATVLLINPYDGSGMGAMQNVGGKQVPLGLCYVAACLEKDGHTAYICDELVDQDGISACSVIKPTHVLMSVYPSCSERAMAIIRHIRTTLPLSRLIIGGPVAAKSSCRHYFEKLSPDAMVMGEGERVAPLLVCSPPQEWHTVKGVLYKNSHGELSFSGEAEIIPNLDALPFPSLHLLDLTRYKGPTEQGFFESVGNITTSIMTARGCQFRCNFCNSAGKYGGKVRFRSPNNVVDELELDATRFGIRHFTINDDTFTANIPRVIELCKEIISRKLSITWIVQTRAEITTQEMFDYMKKAGCVMVAFGVESGSPKVLERANKVLDLEFVRRGVQQARKAGLRVKTYFQVNLPGEEEEDVDMSITLAKELNPDYLWLSRFTVLPDTVFFDQLKDSNVFDRMDTQTYFSSNRDTEIEKRYRRFLRAFYLRPGYFINFLRRFSIQEFLYLARTGVTFLRI